MALRSVLCFLLPGALAVIAWGWYLSRKKEDGDACHATEGEAGQELPEQHSLTAPSRKGTHGSTANSNGLDGAPLRNGSPGPSQSGLDPSEGSDVKDSVASGYMLREIARCADKATQTDNLNEVPEAEGSLRDLSRADIGQARGVDVGVGQSEEDLTTEPPQKPSAEKQSNSEVTELQKRCDTALQTVRALERQRDTLQYEVDHLRDTLMEAEEMQAEAHREGVDLRRELRREEAERRRLEAGFSDLQRQLKMMSNGAEGEQEVSDDQCPILGSAGEA